MSTVFDIDFKIIKEEVFWGEDLDNLSESFLNSKFDEKILINSIF